jgi:hypothetical protein
MTEYFHLTRQHYLVFDSDHNVDACNCGYPADDSDCGHGDAVVDHLMAIAWHDGHQRGLADADLQHAADNPYDTEEQ